MLQPWAQSIIDKLILYLPKLAGAILVLIMGLFLIGFIRKITIKGMENKKVDPSLVHFLGGLINISLKIMLFITVISMFGVQMTSFIAIIGAAGLAIGLALQGSLANFAGGVLILLFKPYKVGDYIETEGHSGTVNQIQIFNTILKSPDNKTIIIPNGPISNGSLVNYSTEKLRRIDMIFGIGYDDDIDKARKAILKLVRNDKRILGDPEPQIIIGELADSSVNFKVRVWAESIDYWKIYFEMQESVKKEFDKQNISIPFPQRDVHMIK